VPGDEQHALIRPGGQREQALLIRLRHGASLAYVVPRVIPRLDFRTGDRFAGDGVQHEALDVRFPAARADDQRQVADPEIRERNEIVLLAEARIVAGDQEVEARLQIGRRFDLFRPLLVVCGGRQVGRPLAHGRLGQQRPALVVVQLFRPVPRRLQSRVIRLGDDAEEDLGQVSVADLDFGKWLVPDTFDVDLRRLGLDLQQQVMAAAAADAIGKSVFAPLGQPVGLDQIAFLLQDGRPVVQRACGDLVVAPLVGEAFKRGFIAGVLFFAERFVPAEVQPQQVGVDQSCLVLVGLMELEQVLIQPDRLQCRRVLVRCLDLPGDELLGRREDGAVGHQVERILGFGPRLFAGVVELERIVRQEIEHRRPVAVRYGAFLQQVVVRGDGRGFQHGFARQGFGELLVDLGQDARQVPGGEVVAGRLGGRRALQEPPAVLLEVVPVPIGQDGLHDRCHLRGRFRDLGFHAGDLFFRLVALNAALQRDFFGDRLDGFGVSLVLHGSRDDRLQLLDGRLGQPFGDRLVDLLPLLVADPGPSGQGQQQCE